MSKTQGGARIYRRNDVERVLRLKHLLFVEGLTLAGARRRMLEEQPASTTAEPGMSDLAELLGSDARERILQVRQGLRTLSVLLSRAPGQPGDLFELEASEPAIKREKAGKPAAKVVKAAAKKKK